MSEPIWLALDTILQIHVEQIKAFGGLPGVRDRGALESALGRPINKFHYEGETHLPMLAAAYCFGLGKNHAFNDGNKRVAFVAAATFLGLNGLDVDCTQEEVVIMMLGIASGEFAEAGLARWIADRSAPI